MERRERQNRVLTTGTESARSSNTTRKNGYRDSLYESRWVRISLRAQQSETFVFSNLMTHVNEDSLMEAFKELDGKKALGVDSISKSEYAKNLKVNLENLALRVQRGTYRPKAKREVLIPKTKGQTRAIAIACFEDKLVDIVVSKILTAVFEPLFIKNSFGYRPNRSADNAIKTCYRALCRNKRPYVVEIDFSRFFNTIPHRKLMKILGQRISDNRFKGLIGRFLRGDLITATGDKTSGVLGTSQGSAMSPILANIYLNEVIDQWFIKDHSLNDNTIVRYADDAVFLFKRENDAVKFLEDLEQRVKRYDLTLNKDKTRLLTLKKQEHNQFDFLGFTFYWGKQSSRIILKVKTQKERLHRSIKAFVQWIKQVRNKEKLKTIWKLTKSKIRGHINYYGYWMNGLKLRHFYKEVVEALFKWLNRRSQRKSYDWEGFKERLKYFPLLDVPFKEMKLKELGWNPYA